MPRNTSVLFHSLTRRLSDLELTRKKVESLAAQGLLAKRDVDTVYEALFLRAFTELEGFIEDLFFGLLARRLRHPSSSVRARVKLKSHMVAREIVLAGDKYVDWFPYERHTKRLAETFFTGGRPFCSLSPADLNELEKLVILRNAIAHRSSHALSTSERKVTRQLPLRPREKSPVGFLRGQIRIAPPQTRFEATMSTIVQLGQKLSR